MNTTVKKHLHFLLVQTNKEKEIYKLGSKEKC